MKLKYNWCKHKYTRSTKITDEQSCKGKENKRQIYRYSCEVSNAWIIQGIELATRWAGKRKTAVIPGNGGY